MQRGLQIRHPKASVFGDSGSELIAVALLLTLALSGLDAHLLVVLLQGGQILASLRKLTLLHAFTDIPVHKRALAVHQVELVVDPRENLRDRRGVADHAACTHDLCQVATGYHCGWLVIDAALESCGAPVHELDCPLGLDSRHSSIHIFRHDVTPIHHATSHVLPVARIALHEHRGRLEDTHGDLSDGELLV